MNYQQRIGPWAYIISLVVWGSAGILCGCNQGTTATPHSKATALHSVLLEPSLLPPTQPGQEDEGATIAGCLYRE